MEAEETASEMIRQKRVDAKIDQVEGMLFFNNSLFSSSFVSLYLWVFIIFGWCTGQDPLSAWDGHIDLMCNTANEAADMIMRDKMQN